jgi:hypothetical protein
LRTVEYSGCIHVGMMMKIDCIRKNRVVFESGI